MAKFSPLYDVTIWEAEADVRATFSLADKYDLGGPPGAFQHVEFLLRVKSPAPPEAVARLCQHAERACHASQTFRHPVATTMAVDLNGSELDISSPEDLS
ncbi:MAG TPA: hypothetical protein VNF75_06525 [Candidatus Dormibacteraeota bacterium]|nr:hypothetical protein [Candidatus Dormibacteraeota bacterium]